MVIENRDAVIAGVKLTATYKKQDYVCTVEVGADGKLAFVYDGKSYSSPSAAGSAVIGTAANGWRFWSIEGVVPAAQGKAKSTTTRARPSAPKRAPKAKKGARIFYRIPGNKDTAEGQTRYYCNACAASFIAVDAAFGGMAVDACPNGHRNDDPELTSAPGGAAVATNETEASAE